MKPWTSRSAAKKLGFIVINVAIVALAVPVLLEIWGLLDNEIRNRLLGTVGVLLIVGICLIITNYAFSVAEEDEAAQLAELKRTQESNLGENLKKAKSGAGADR